jgi:hypothetical protein
MIPSMRVGRIKRWSLLACTGLVLCLGSGLQGLTQPHIIIRACQCYRLKNERLLYDKMKGAKGIMEAAVRIESYFDPENGDHFTLECLQGCEAPRSLEFPSPEKKRRMEPERIDNRTTYQPATQPIKVQLTIRPEDFGNGEENWRLAKGYEARLENEFYRNDPSIQLLAFNKEQGQDPKAIRIHRDSAYGSSAGDFSIIGEIGTVQMKWSPESDHPSPHKVLRMYFKLIDNETRDIIYTWNSDTTNYARINVRSFNPNPSSYNGPAKGLVNSSKWKDRLDSIKNNLNLETATDTLTRLAVANLVGRLHPFQRDSLVSVLLTGTDSSKVSPALLEAIQSAAPVVALVAVNQNKWHLSVACSKECLRDMIAEMDISGNLDASIAKDGSILLSPKPTR